ncbi:magnesium transporter [Mycoplasma phocimorsus]|uniref:Magnesium transporter MgtE n=1 Tax=Mycoplasma phocimorsus TaxID=3045839 RepID=A0AAJ1PRJ4_9MOLU|nr:magnesium transporter [Mycoplasma phocimorsus]MDJ1646022.1 magnesium transporter [Mycoplasma phocimorsus]MDJ1646303.1 magnesium transporter [Mycoplasma phocimorsus]MDJ1646908.1 magnesium transporter [Mycoplasma phocimorsus]MDJ1647875.1 magnesium transporter [Mycoplasma phocimorsus]MDJ1648425.1 magnesium transporter [Mycoplasma phocimorsus]
MLIDIINNKNINEIRTYINNTPIADVAYELENASASQIFFLLRVIGTEDAAELFSYFEPDIQQKIVEKILESDNTEILNILQTDELADLLEEMPALIAKRILEITPKEKRNIINVILNYKDDEVGSIAAVDIVLLKDTSYCKNGLNKIKRLYEKKNAELSHYFFVVNENRKLVGGALLEDIVFAEEGTKINEVMFPVASVKTTDKIEYASQVFAEHDMSSIPVVDKNDFVVGMITSDDIIDAINEAATEDIYKMAAISDKESEKEYLKKSNWSIVKSRVFWLILLLIGSTLSQLIIEKFTGVAEKALSLTAISAIITTAVITGMVPVISGSAGNAGSQSATTIMRAYALGEIEKSDFKKAIWKEFNVSVVTGSILFAVNFARLLIYFLSTSYNSLTAHPAPFIIISLVSSLSLFIVIIFSKFLGTIIPIIAIKLKRDPAVMSAPLLSTMTDAISTLIFFGITLAVLLLIYPPSTAVII